MQDGVLAFHRLGDVGLTGLSGLNVLDELRTLVKIGVDAVVLLALFSGEVAVFGRCEVEHFAGLGPRTLARLDLLR